MAINFRLLVIYDQYQGHRGKMLSLLSLVLTTPMNNLSPVSATPAINCSPESTPLALFVHHSFITGDFNGIYQCNFREKTQNVRF